MNDWFRKFSLKVSEWAGSQWAFFIANFMVILWLIYAAPQGFSGESQMPINTTTTIITFLMTFIILHSQNRDTKEIKLMHKAVILHNKHIRNRLAKLENLTDKEITTIEEELERESKGEE